MAEFKALQRRAFEQAGESGFHDEYILDRTVFASKLALIHSEVSEALEEARNGKSLQENWQSLPEKPEGVPAELADIVIRVFDLAGWLVIDLEAAIVEKLDYNKSRSYKHGKKF